MKHKGPGCEDHTGPAGCDGKGASLTGNEGKSKRPPSSRKGLKIHKEKRTASKKVAQDDVIVAGRTLLEFKNSSCVGTEIL